MTPPRDGEPPSAADVPPTRRGSGLLIGFPDDGALSRRMRRIDEVLGKAEQVVLVALLAGVVIIAASHALLDRLAEVRIPHKDNLIRSGVYAMALLGGAFASHQAKHLTMDLLTRSLSARNRLYLRVALGVFIVAVMLLVIRSGWHWIVAAGTTPVVGDPLFTPAQVAHLVPIGCGLIIAHTILHMGIDLDYLARRRTPPERQRSGH